MTRTILIGPAASGKSRAAGLMAKGVTLPVLLNFNVLRHTSLKDINRHISSLLNKIDKNRSDFIICDDIPLIHLKSVFAFFCREEFTINPQLQEPFIAKPQNIILIARDNVTYEDIPKDTFYLRRFNIIECKQSHDHHIEMIMHHPKEIDPVYRF